MLTIVLKYQFSIERLLYLKSANYHSISRRTTKVVQFCTEVKTKPKTEMLDESEQCTSTAQALL